MKFIQIFCCLSLVTFMSLGQEYPKNLERDLSNPASLKGYIDSLISSEIERERLPSASFIMVHKGKIIHSKAWGVIDIESDQHVDINHTIFRIGSITKVITAIGLVQLAEKGLIDLQADVNEYLPKSLQLISKYDEDVKVWHLMTHTGGFDQKLRGRLYENKADRPTLRDFLEGELVQVHPPGTFGSYDTYGISLGGAIIEFVSGLSYQEYVSEYILRPLGMDWSGIEKGDLLTDQVAIGYGLTDGKYIPQQYEYYTTTPASSMDASTMDMSKLMIALLSDGDNEILKKESLAIIHGKPQFRNAPDTPGFSYGFWEELFEGERIIWHGGIMNGYTSSMYLIPKYELGFFLVYTRDFETGPNPNLRNILPDRLMNRWFENIEGRNELFEDKDMDLNKFSGTYAQSIYCRMCFEGEGARRRIYSVEATDGDSLEFLGIKFYPVGPSTFIDKDGKYRLSFRENENGIITHVFGSWSSDATYERLGSELISSVKSSGFSDDEMLALEAKTYRAIGNWELAANAYSEITRIRPTDGIAYHYLGLTLKNADRPNKAIMALKKAYELGQWERYTARMLAELYYSNGDSENTIKWLNEIVTSSRKADQSNDDIRHFILMSPTLKDLENSEEFKIIFE